MVARAAGTRRMITGASLALAVAGVASSGLGRARPALAADGGTAAYLPLAVRQHSGPFPDPTALYGGTTSPTAGPTQATATPAASPGLIATASPSAGSTVGPTSAPSPTATPTLEGSEVAYPRQTDAIVLQIGRTDTSQSTQVFEEMNGTPWFTLYGDGSYVAGRELFDNSQALYTGKVDDYTVQRWLRRLVGPIGFLTLGSDYNHPRASTPEVHVYLAVDAGTKRVSLRSFRQFEQFGVPDTYPEAERIAALVAFVRSLEAETVAAADCPSATPFSPICYTVLAQYDHAFEELADQFAPWDYELSVFAIARAAPTAASNYLDHVVGHRFVEANVGQEVRALVRPQWEYWFPYENMGAFFSVGGRPYAVAARQEVPGGSLFLPNEGFDTRGSFWYRRDAGSGTCPGLPHRAPPALAPDERGRLDRKPAVP